MCTRITKLYLLLFSVLLLTCRTNDEPLYDSEFGSIYVTVKQSGAIIPDATISTAPESEFFQTDASGSAILRDLNPNTYQVLAYHPDYGSGTNAVVVTRGEVSGVEIDLIPGVFENPIISFIFPSNGGVLDLGAPNQLSVMVSDNNDSPEDINLEWSSNIDGFLSNESAASNGIASITVNDLSEGEHNIQVKGTDSDGIIGGTTVTISVSDIPNSVFLNVLDGLSNGIQLSWTTSDEPDFESYNVYRSVGDDSNFESINIINDLNTTTYVDNTIVIGQDYYYRIGVKLGNGEESTSNTQFTTFQGVSISVGTQVERMIVDPSRPFIYAIDRVNNSLLFINTDGNELTKTISVGSSPTDLDIGIEGDLLFIANFGGTEINVVDLETQEIDYSFFVDTDIGTWDGNPYRIAALSDNRLAFTSEDQWNSVKIVNATTGTNIANGGSVYQPNLFTNQAGTVLYVGESGTTGSQVLRYDVSSNALVEVDESNSGSAWGRNGFITHNGEYIFFRKQKILATNLQSILGTFPDEIFASNSDGSIVMGEEQYFNGDNFAIMGDLPVSSQIMASDPNNGTFYIYDVLSSNIIVFTP